MKKLLKLFGKTREELQVLNVRATRALHVPDASGYAHNEVEIELLVEDGGYLRLRLQMPHARRLIEELSQSYWAANPPLSRGQNLAADWQGMDDQG